MTGNFTWERQRQQDCLYHYSQRCRIIQYCTHRINVIAWQRAILIYWKPNKKCVIESIVIALHNEIIEGKGLTLNIKFTVYCRQSYVYYNCKRKNKVLYCTRNFYINKVVCIFEIQYTVLSFVLYWVYWGCTVQVILKYLENARLTSCSITHWHYLYYITSLKK